MRWTVKKIGIINQPISSVIASLGHTDRLVVSDAGLPIPSNVKRIDLALREGTPGIIETLETVLSEMQVESVIIAEEISDHNPQIESGIKEVLGDIPIMMMSHEKFKQETQAACAIIRTGEFSPYANIILIAGVVF
jgi:D-ribose pyranase